MCGHLTVRCLACLLAHLRIRANSSADDILQPADDPLGNRRSANNDSANEALVIHNVAPLDGERGCDNHIIPGLQSREVSFTGVKASQHRAWEKTHSHWIQKLHYEWHVDHSRETFREVSFVITRLCPYLDIPRVDPLNWEFVIARDRLLRNRQVEVLRLRAGC